MRPTHNGNTALQYFERGNALEIRNGIMFDFYPGLTQIYPQVKLAIPVDYFNFTD